MSTMPKVEEFCTAEEVSAWNRFHAACVSARPLEDQIEGIEEQIGALKKQLKQLRPKMRPHTKAIKQASIALDGLPGIVTYRAAFLVWCSTPMQKAPVLVS